MTNFQPLPQLTPVGNRQATNQTSGDQNNFNIKKSLLDILLQKNIITQEIYNSIKFAINTTGRTEEDAISEINLVPEIEIARAKSILFNIPVIDLSNISIPNEVLSLVPKETASNRNAVVFEKLSTGKIKVAMVDPTDLEAIQFIESQTKFKVEAYFSAKSLIRNIIDTKYGTQIGSEVDQAMEEFGADLTVSSVGMTADTSDNLNNKDAPIIRIVNMILDYGVKNKASDIHIEPRTEKVAVRFRMGGFLNEKLTVPPNLLSAVVTRIKILSNLKIDEHRIPQDGRFQVKTDQGAVDIRVSIMPSIYGEKVVMRILTKSKGVLTLEDTGISGVSYSRLTDALKRTQGIILVTGPTGSGKTQTLASCLKILNQPNVNVITLEDPVEIRVDGVNQTQVNSEVGLTFASGLKAILRQDPDIVMVGEIRDGETASLAVQAALVGRLVLSTLHTNSAAGAFIRMIDMGIEPFLLTSTINLLMAQRLIRTLGQDKMPYEASSDELKLIHSILDSLAPVKIFDDNKNHIFTFEKDTSKLTLFAPVKTPRNNNVGYESRAGIFEALKVTETISNMVIERASINKISEQAQKEGMISMLQDGMIKVLEGKTTIEEILRVQNL